MRILRTLALFALTLGLAVLLGDVTATAQQLTKAEKQAKRKLALKTPQAKPARS